MDENMNGNQPQGMDPNQAYGEQQYYGQDPNAQAYGGQQYYGQDPNAQYYGGQQYYGQDPNAQYYGGQQYYGQDPNAQYYGEQPNAGGSNKGGFDIGKIKDAIVKNKNIVILAAVAIVALILICNICGALFGHGKQSAKSVAKAYVKAIEKEDGKKAYKLVDKKMIKYMKEENEMDKDDIIDGLDDAMEYYLEDLQYEADSEEIGEIKSIKVKVKRVKKYKGDDLDDMKESFEDRYDFKISQYAKVKLKLTLKGEDGECKVDETVYVYKRGGKWYWYY